jgi:hypothetical protein
MTETGTCKIKVKGIVDEYWSDWFDDMTITHSSEKETLFVGPVHDQSALYGLLAKIRDMGLSLISLEYMPGENHKVIE